MLPIHNFDIDHLPEEVQKNVSESAWHVEKEIVSMLKEGVAPEEITAYLRKLHHNYLIPQDMPF